jgi:hypothetical protein
MIITPGKPPPKPAPAPPKKVTTPAKEAPLDVKELFRIAEAALPRYRYAKPVRQFFGGVQFVGGAAEAVVGGVVAVWTSPTIAGAAAGTVVGLHGLDQASSGWTTMWTGESSKTYVFRAGAWTGKELGGKEWEQFGGQAAEISVGAAVGALGMWQMTRPVKLNFDLPPPISEAEYFNIANRPGSTVSMGQYGPYVGEGKGAYGYTEMFGFRRQAQNLGARTLGGEVPDLGPDMTPDMALWFEKPYLEAADHIYFFRTGFESPTATKITWAELEFIDSKPHLKAKTTDIWLKKDPAFKPRPRSKK